MDNWGVPGRCWPAPHGRASSFFRLFFQGLLRVLFAQRFFSSPGAPMVHFEPILESFGLPFAAQGSGGSQVVSVSCSSSVPFLFSLLLFKLCGFVASQGHH